MTIDRVNDGWSTRSGVRVSAPDIAVDGSDRRRRGHQREVCPCEAGARFFFLAQNHPVCLGLRRPRSGGGGGGGAAAGVCRGCRRVAVPPTFVTFPRLCVALGGRAARGRRRPGTRACRPRQAPHTRGYAAAMTEVGRRLEQGLLLRMRPVPGNPGHRPHDGTFSAFRR